MTLLIIGLSLSFIAIGVLYYLNNQLKRKLEGTNKALLAFQKEFTQYQVNQKRFDEKETAKKEIRFDNIARSIKKNEDAVYSLNEKHEGLPKLVGKIVSQVEFAQNKIK